MNDGNYLEILGQGIDHWNRWRQQNPAVIPNLAHANLQGLFQTGLAIKGFTAPLSGINFSGMYLQHAFIESANSLIQHK